MDGEAGRKEGREDGNRVHTTKAGETEDMGGMRKR